MPTSTTAIAGSGDSSNTIIGSSAEDKSLKESAAAQNEVQELEKFSKQIYPCQPGEAQCSVAISADQETNRSFGNDQNIVPHDGVFNNIAVSTSSNFRSNVDDGRDIEIAVQDAVLREQVCTNIFQFFKFLQKNSA